MCGIAGVVASANGVRPALHELIRMAAMLAHRGPDGYGLYRDSRAGLAHTRLSIIDLSGGAQPIHNEDKSIWIVFNGEIFNYRELRMELESRGHRFYTQTDTEVIVHAFEEYRSDAWRRLNGQFSFALWDSGASNLWLVRDRVGILPLYFSRQSTSICFGSEAKALFAGGRLNPGFSQQGLRQVFTRWAATAPATVFESVESVRPGEAIRFDAELREARHVYWAADFEEDRSLAEAPREEIVEALSERLRDSIRLRLRADVPVGAYLSGGLDSSVIAWLTRNAGISNLQTFSIGFADPEYDETAAQRRMTDLLGTTHHAIACGAAEIAAALPETIWHCETPLLRTGPVPMFLLSRLVRDAGMKVVLTGEGADEYLCGYDIFKEDRIRRFWARQPESTARPSLIARLYAYVGDPRSRQSRFWQAFFRDGLERTDHPFYSHRIRWRNTAWSLRFLTSEGVSDGAEAEFDLVRRSPPDRGRWRPLARAQWLEVETFMSAYLLASQGDRVGMAHGVEARYPFLDPDVVDYCAALPSRHKLCGLNDKAALRSLAARELPAAVWRRTKQPYRAPISTVFFGRGSPEYVRELLSRDELSRYGLIQVEPACRIVDKAIANQGVMGGEREEMALIGLLTLQLLARQMMTEFAGRARQLEARLRTRPPTVFEDRCPDADRSYLKKASA